MCINPMIIPQADTLAAQYEIALEVQAGCQKRIRSEVNRAVSRVIFDTATSAIKDTRGGIQSGKFKVVSAPTGSSKTTSAIAFAVAGFNSIPGFSCAFVVEEIRAAQEIYSQLVDMLPPEVVGIWTSQHDAKRPPEVIPDGYRLFFIDQMRELPIVVYTHRKWLGEMERDRDEGVRHYWGKPRDVLFIDEQPAVIDIIAQTPAQILSVRDAIAKFEPDHPWVSTLGEVHTRMEAVFTSTGNEFEYVELLNCLEAADFSEERADALWRKHYRYAPSLEYTESFRFLHAATLGYCFLSRQVPRGFIAYLPLFKAEPNQVLLDATADVSGISLLLGGQLANGLPAIDYCNLTINHLDQPREFRSVNEVVKVRSRAVSYADWIRSSVMEHTSEGDIVLVVMHKAMIEMHDLFPHAPEEPNLEVFPGRKTFVIWWGQGIGSNQYKNCTKTFLFSEFYAPQKATVATTLGATARAARDANLNKLNSSLSGDYLTVQEGNLLRWTKQLACRGNVRNVSEDGTCGRMDLYTSMDFKRLVKNLDVLFPGAKAPTRVNRKAKQAGATGESKGRHGLINLLSSPDAIQVSFPELSEKTGIARKHLSRELASPNVAPVVAAYGWSLTTNKTLGLPGKGNWLVRSGA